MFEFERELHLKCEECGSMDLHNQYWANEYKNFEESYRYEFGTKKDQMGNRWWTCDSCGASMYVKRKGKRVML